MQEVKNSYSNNSLKKITKQHFAELNINMIVDRPTSVALVCFILWLFFDLYNLCSSDWNTVEENKSIRKHGLFKVIVNGVYVPLSVFPSNGKLLV